MRRAALAIVASVGACTLSPGRIDEGRTIPPGRWAGEQVVLEISAGGRGHIALPCATAEFDGPVRLDVGGHFLARGSFRRNPDAAFPQSAAAPANVSGRLDPDNSLWLDIATRDSYPVRSARLRRGAEPIIFGCP